MSKFIFLSKVQIDIIDINNKYPIIHEFDMSLELYENATTGDVITQIPASDLDRDGNNQFNNIIMLLGFLFFTFISNDNQILRKNARGMLNLVG